MIQSFLINKRKTRGSGVS